MKLSIIIPIYNPSVEDITRCLDSIYTSTPPDFYLPDYQVICVNDFSTESDGIKAVETYRYNGFHPENLILIHHKENLRQGGARNTGVRYAEGEYIQFIDHDDTFTPNAISNIVSAIAKYKGVDLIMFDLQKVTEDGSVLLYQPYSLKNHSNIVSGGEFLKTQEVPWTPWLYTYRREFLLKNQLYFVEKILFEDVDFVLKCTINAEKIIFIPETIVVYRVRQYQTSSIGNSIEKISDLYFMSYRIGALATEASRQKMEGANAIVGHYVFSVFSHFKRFMWRLPFSNIKELLCKYPINSNLTLPKGLVFVSKYPKLSAFIMTCAKPILHTLYALYRFSKYIRTRFLSKLKASKI